MDPHKKSNSFFLSPSSVFWSTDPPKIWKASFFLWIHRFFDVLHSFYISYKNTIQALFFDPPPMSTDPPKILKASFFLWIHRFFNVLYSFYISFKNTLQALFFDPPMSTDPPKIFKASFFLWIHRFFNALYPFYMYWRILSKLHILIHRCPPIHRSIKTWIAIFSVDPRWI